MERYALLLSGGVNHLLNHPRYLNDLRLTYTTLVRHYGFDKKKVFASLTDAFGLRFVLYFFLLFLMMELFFLKEKFGYADGQAVDLDGDGQSEIDFAASKAHLNALFAELQSKMSRDTLFCMFVTNHGGQTVSGTMNVHIYLWDDVYITDTELAELLSKLQCRYMLLVFGQCYSGGLIAKLAAPNRIICTACGWDELSWARTGLMYDEFLYHFLSTLRGETPEGEQIPEHRYISDAFQYTKAQDSKDEHPQISDPSQIGNALTLEG